MAKLKEPVGKTSKKVQEENTSEGFVSFTPSDASAHQGLMDNKKIIHIIESFILLANKKITSFIRKKTTAELNGINISLVESLGHDPEKTVMLAFQVAPSRDFGFIMIDFTVLHAMIDLLYGGKIYPDESIIRGLGHAGIKIATKVSDIFIQAFQDALNEHLKLDLSLTNITTSLFSIFNQKLDHCCDFSFNVMLEGVSGQLHLVIPEKILTHVISKTKAHHDEDPQHILNADAEFSDYLKQELIELKVNISAVLPDILLQVKDVVNLQPGDIIPIGDPTMVYITHNQKKIFSASAGQSNAHRLVKIVDKL